MSDEKETSGRTWHERFEDMLKGLMWSYDDAAKAAGYKSGESIRTTVQNKSREFPKGLRMAILVYERYAFKQMQKQNLIDVMQADQESGLYDNEATR